MTVVKDTVTPTLENLSSNIDRAVDKAYGKWTLMVVKKMKDRVPINTGALRDTIRGYKDGGKWTIEVGNERIDYAPYIEYGTRFQRAQPFFNNTINEMEPLLINMIQTEIGKLL